MEFTRREVLFSGDRLYRYKLFIEWDPAKPKVSSIGMNPSLADETRSDPTITKEINYAKRWGAGSLMKLNLFGIISPYPTILGHTKDPVGPLNTASFIAEQCENSLFVVATWGDYRKYARRDHYYRCLEIVDAVPVLHCLKCSKLTGMPYHPLYLPASVTPIPYSTAPKREINCPYTQAEIEGNLLK